MRISSTDIYASHGSDERQRFWFSAFLAALVVMNALDGLLTVLWVWIERAVEINPMMAIVLDIHPALFMSAKIALVSLGAILLWRYRTHAFAVLSLGAACVAYWVVLTHHWKMILAFALGTA
jgi:hypothetical protein